ncbi:hypothetical protein FOA52_013789 [Chlamydomonas sp. UWO 241]|nr:hypothetical protein FOA52_013789 [Chlamydomonas sp. UWO 241]
MLQAQHGVLAPLHGLWMVAVNDPQPEHVGALTALRVYNANHERIFEEVQVMVTPLWNNVDPPPWKVAFKPDDSAVARAVTGALRSKKMSCVTEDGTIVVEVTLTREGKGEIETELSKLKKTTSKGKLKTLWTDVKMRTGASNITPGRGLDFSQLDFSKLDFSKPFDTSELFSKMSVSPQPINQQQGSLFVSTSSAAAGVAQISDTMGASDQDEADEHLPGGEWETTWEAAEEIRGLITVLGNALPLNLSDTMWNPPVSPPPRSSSAKRCPRSPRSPRSPCAGLGPDSARGERRRSYCDGLNPGSGDWARLARQDLEQRIYMATLAANSN